MDRLFAVGVELGLAVGLLDHSVHDLKIAGGHGEGSFCLGTGAWQDGVGQLPRQVWLLG